MHNATRNRSNGDRQLNEKHEVTQMWKEHCEELYNINIDST